jgi:hypothetical protein
MSDLRYGMGTKLSERKQKIETRYSEENFEDYVFSERFRKLLNIYSSLLELICIK